LVARLTLSTRLTWRRRRVRRVQISNGSISTIVAASGFADALPMEIGSFEARIIAAAAIGR
jgi:hypothetical protein